MPEEGCFILPGGPGFYKHIPSQLFAKYFIDKVLVRRVVEPRNGSASGLVEEGQRSLSFPCAILKEYYIKSGSCR